MSYENVSASLGGLPDCLGFQLCLIGFHFNFIIVVIISLFCIIGKCADLERLPHLQSKICFCYGVSGIMCVCALY